MDFARVERSQHGEATDVYGGLPRWQGEGSATCRSGSLRQLRPFFGGGARLWQPSLSPAPLQHKRSLVQRGHLQASLSLQCRLLGLCRSSLYYRPREPDAEALALMRRIDELYTPHPFDGSRRMSRHLGREGWAAGRDRVRRLMRKMGGVATGRWKVRGIINFT